MTVLNSKPFWGLSLFVVLTALVLQMKGGQSDEAVTYSQAQIDAFKHPELKYRPMVRWWWPGGAVDEQEIGREIDLLKNNGFGGAEIQSFTPHFVRLDKVTRERVNDYAEPEFFKNVKYAADYAASKGMWLDYTFGSAWPSGGGFNVTPELALLELTMSVTSVTGEEKGRIYLNLPERTKRLGALNAFDQRVKDPAVADWADRLDARTKIVAVIAMKGEAPSFKPNISHSGFTLYPWNDVTQSGQLDVSSVIDLTSRLREDGALEWKPEPGTWQVFVFQQNTVDMGVMGAAGRGPQLIIDHMNPAALNAHAERVLKPLGQQPRGMRALFVDSLELMQDLPWTEDFAAQFEALRGYSIRPYLPFLLQPGWMQAWDEHYSPAYYNDTDPVAQRVREDYRQTISDLMFSRFIEPFVAQSHAQGLQAKFQAHGGAIDIVKGYGTADIPETEDLVHGGDPIMMRFARSGAHLYGREIVSAESLVWKDRPYDVTPDEMKKRIDLIISGGVNSVVLHGMNYSLDTDNWPGWHAFQPSPFAQGFSSMLNEANPIWPAVKPLAEYISRLQWFARKGSPNVPVAYYYGQMGYYVGIEDEGAGEQLPEKHLLNHGYDFDRINTESLLGVDAVDKQIVTASGMRYQALVMPDSAALDERVAAKVQALKEQGIMVVFLSQMPTRATGLNAATERDAKVQQAMQALNALKTPVVEVIELSRILASEGVKPNLSFTSESLSDISFVQREQYGQTWTFIRNGAANKQDVSVMLPGIQQVSQWDALTGEVKLIPVNYQGKSTKVPISLEAESSILLSWQQGRYETQVRKPVDTLSLPGSGWTLDVSGWIKRKPTHYQFAPFRLQDFSSMEELSHFAGQASYEQTIEIPAKFLTEQSLVQLDLGEVYNVATVTLNGHTFSPLFSSPYQLDVTQWLKPGQNQLSIVVYNTPQNSMLNASKAGYKSLKPVSAGLIGPITLTSLKSGPFHDESI